MPALGADMDEGTLNEWLVKPGDKVTRGQVVAVVETTKAAVEVECWHEGTVHELLVPVGETVQVGTALATLLAPGETAEQHAASVDRATVQPRPRAAPAAAPGRRTAAADAGAARPPTPLGIARSAPPRHIAGRRHRSRHRHRPAGRGHHHRRRARRRGDGAAEQPSRPRPTAQPQMRRSIAAAMSRSKREIPHYYLADEILMETALTWLADAQRASDRSPSGAAGRAAVEGRRAGGAALRRVQRILARRRLRACAGRSRRRGHLAARRRPCRTGHPRRRRQEARRIDERPHRPGGPRPRLLAAQLGDVGPHHHGHQPRRSGR